ncbi:MAG: hypothetical protein IJT30_11825 [Muribaculaceae bacterium]|nr:hypothetical protein [Muribaculaceae bacterium]
MYKKVYLTVVGLLFAALAVVFDTFPRSRVSELEKRELATFPAFSLDSLATGAFTTQVSAWFSDTEPYRDVLMSLSMNFKQWIALNMGDDQVVFHMADAEMEETPEEKPDDESVANRDLKEYNNTITAEEKAKIAHAGIVIVGSGPNVRALMTYGGGPNGGVAFAEAANAYKQALGDAVQVYCMAIPTSSEYYCPESVKHRIKSQRATINNIYAHLDPDVKAVDVYSTLGEHADEPIFLRTDHHWAPLGAYYAAKKFAAVAGVPFRDLTAYERHVVRNFVGTMYGYSKDVAVKNAPEDFVYYTPAGANYNTTYINLNVNKKLQVTGEGKPYNDKFFYKFKDGSGGAYSTFMGSDQKITKVETDVANGRRVLILKDSFGNAIPGYLFYSFEQVHVVDYRYFTKNIKRYITDNKITDVLFANNIFVAYNPATARVYKQFLNQ